MQAFWRVVIVLMGTGTLLTPVVARAGNLEPPGDPSATMKTLDEIPGSWSRRLECFTTNSCERFELVLDGDAVLDRETGVVWAKTPDRTNQDWATSIASCYFQSIGDRYGWRPATASEQFSLFESTQLPAGHPFTLPAATILWSATSEPTLVGRAFAYKTAPDGFIGASEKSTSDGTGVWCVRGAVK